MHAQERLTYGPGHAGAHAPRCCGGRRSGALAWSAARALACVASAACSVRRRSPAQRGASACIPSCSVAAIHSRGAECSDTSSTQRRYRRRRRSDSPATASLGRPAAAAAAAASSPAPSPTPPSPKRSAIRKQSVATVVARCVRSHPWGAFVAACCCAVGRGGGPPPAPPTHAAAEAAAEAAAPTGSTLCPSSASSGSSSPSPSSVAVAWPRPWRLSTFLTRTDAAQVNRSQNRPATKDAAAAAPGPPPGALRRPRRPAGHPRRRRGTASTWRHPESSACS
jgi:hypothetical protein